VDPLAVAAIALNAAANEVSVAVAGANVLASGGPPPPADLVLAADAFYQRELAASVMSFLERARASGAEVLAADLGRAYLPRASLTPVMTYEVPGLAAIEDRDVKTTTVWTLRPSPLPGTRLPWGEGTGPAADGAGQAGYTGDELVGRPTNLGLPGPEDRHGRTDRTRRAGRRGRQEALAAPV
jgi:hypothetical protein